ncbi:hypothetical protein [Marinococcus halotolerans]|uniref:hypothetical protein n=1 Tax=Marinococcus halotolerans TaxID=301092 RepID=UPI0003B4C82B|nr:hypothetical protein [Marinococcus halotolerans]
MSKWLVTLMVVMVCFFPAQSVEAHKLTIDNEREDTVQVQYDDGSFSKRTTVHVLDKEGDELTSGSLNDQGTFSYAPHADKAETLIAEDGMGHQAKVQIDNLTSDENGYSTWSIVGGVILSFLFVSIAWIIKRKFVYT